MNHFSGRILAFESLDSTNTYVKAHLDALPDRSIVTANTQTAGRGRSGKSWASPPDTALYLTALWKNPAFDPSLLPLYSALAVCRTLEQAGGLPCFLKWPNDVLLNRKKVCGILCESVIGHPDRPVWSGIGINVNQSADDFAGEALPYATSLYLETGRHFPVALLREQLADELDQVSEEAARDGFARLRPEYERRLYNIGREVRVLYRDREVQATALGVLENGNLLCRNEQGTFRVNSGEASVRGLYGYV